jgi:hypothetical protein
MPVPQENWENGRSGENGEDAEDRAAANGSEAEDTPEPAVTRRPDDPGAHSGAEEEPRPRTVPGTASADEGYAHTDEGTAAADPLEGVRRDSQDD